MKKLTYTQIQMLVKDENTELTYLKDVDDPESFDGYWHTIGVWEIVDWLKSLGFVIINPEENLVVEAIDTTTKEEWYDEEELERKSEQFVNDMMKIAPQITGALFQRTLAYTLARAMISEVEKENSEEEGE